ncbi:MAG TPA: tetratricopeptide repeat protein [Anaeromyxobacteraceae bacterium]|nr:tetratricopeptide repeat protein [Anaeromyxobacteraceae bacterium]
MPRPFLLVAVAALAAAPALAAPGAPGAIGSGPGVPNGPVSARAEAAYLRGRLAEQQSDWRAALDAYRAAVEADPAAPALRVSLAEALARTGHLQRADAEARRAIELDPSGPAAAEAWLILGKTAAISRRPAAAEQALRSAVDAQKALAAARPPGEAVIDPEPWRLLAQLRLDAGDAADAEAVLTDLGRRSPADGAAGLRDLGRVVADRKDLDGAAALFRKAVSVDRRDLDAWRRLAELEESRRRFDAAREAWEGLVRQDPDDAEGLVALGRLSLRAGESDAARAFFDAAIHAGPEDAGVRARVGFAWLDARRPQEAIAVVDGGLRTRADPRLLYVRGVALREERRWKEAAAAFGAVSSGDPDLDLAALAGRAAAMVQYGKGAEALALLAPALQAHPGEPRLVAARAHVLERSGKGKEAVAFLEKELASRPGDERLLFALGVAQDRAGDRAGAIATMQRLLTASPDNADAMNFVGYSWAERGERLEEAEALVSRAVELDPDNGSFLDSLGWIRFQRGDVAGAIALLERAEALAGPEPTILEHLGDAYRKSLRDADAARAWRRALQAIDEGAETDLPGQRAGIEKKLRDLPGDVRPARR